MKEIPKLNFFEPVLAGDPGEPVSTVRLGRKWQNVALVGEVIELQKYTGKNEDGEAQYESMGLAVVTDVYVEVFNRLTDFELARQCDVRHRTRSALQHSLEENYKAVGGTFTMHSEVTVIVFARID